MYTTEQKVDQLHDFLINETKGEGRIKASVADPDGSKVRARRASFQAGEAMSPLALVAAGASVRPSAEVMGSSFGKEKGSGDALLSAKVDSLADQLAQVLASQAAMSKAVANLTEKVDAMQPA